METGPAGGEEELFRLLEDLEARAGSEFAAEREAELADRVRAGYREVSLASRMRASIGRELTCQVRGVGTVVGVLTAVGAEWCELASPHGSWWVSHAAVDAVRGASDRSVPDEALRVVDQLGWGSRMRRLADAEAELLVHLLDATTLRLRLVRVGQDFVEAREEGSGQVVLLARAALAAVRVDRLEE